MPRNLFNKLTVRWNKRENDFTITFPSKPDGHLAHHVFFGKIMGINNHRTHENPFPWLFDPSFVDELKSRGYDVTTLKFSVEKNKKEIL